MNGLNNSAGLSKKDVRATTAEKLKGMLKDIDQASADGSKTGFTARSRISALFDAGTFVETGAYVCRTGKEDEFEGVICGYGAIEGRLAFAFSQDMGRMKGAFDEGHAKKIASVYEAAIKNGAPVIGIFDSCGAVVYDGVSALAGYGKVMKCVSDASGIIPQVAVVPGVCAGSAATVAAMFDVTVTVKDSTQLYVNSLFASESGAPESGMAAHESENETEAYAFARRLISLLPANNAEGIVEIDISDDINRRADLSAAFANEAYNIRDILDLIGDGCMFTEIYSGFAPEMVTGFSAFGGIVTGIIANNPAEKDGALTVGAARKASKFLSFCDSFGIPVLTLVDSCGLEVSKDAENAPYSSELARLAMAYASSENSKVTVVLGRAYGAAYTLMGSKSVGADLALALDRAAISVLPPKSAVAFVWNDRISGPDAKESREELERQWTELCSSPVEAAEKGEIDDIIDASELRARICSALSMLASKSELYPDRRHIVLPL